MSLIALHYNHLSASKLSYKKRFWCLLIASVFFALFSNTLSYTKLGLYLIYCMAILLLILLIIRKVRLVYYIVLLATLNMGEYSKFVTQSEFYTFRTVGIFGVTFAVIFVFILAVYELLFSKNRFEPFKSPVFVRGLFIFFMALCIGVVHLFFGDTLLAGFKADLYYFIVLFGSFYLAYNFADPEIVEEILLIALLIAPLIILFGWIFLPKGSYGGAPISSFDPLYYMVPLIPSLLFFYKKRSEQEKIPLWLVWTSGVCSVISIILQPSGKSLIFLPLSVILAWLLSIKRSSVKKFALTGTVIILVILLFVPVYSDVMGNYGNVLFKSKSYQVTSLFKGVIKVLNNPEAVYSIAPSPRDRVLEFMNIFEELKEFPVNLLVGNGIGGSFTDKDYNIPFSLGAYSQDQWISRKFYRVHETLNFVFLKFGIVGIFFLLLFAIWLMRKIYRERSGDRAFLYFVLFFGVLSMLGYSLKLAIFFGVTLGVLCSKKAGSYFIREEE